MARQAVLAAQHAVTAPPPLQLAEMADEERESNSEEQLRQDELTESTNIDNLQKTDKSFKEAFWQQQEEEARNLKIFLQELDSESIP